MLQIGDRFGQGLACKVVGEGLGTFGGITKAPLGLWLRQAAALPESLRVLNKKKTPCQQTRSFAFYGPGGIRTLDLSDANRTLSQQSRFCAHLMHCEKRKINVYSSI